MKYKNNDFCSGIELSEQFYDDSINPFSKEWSSLEYYNYERGFDMNDMKCRCLNQNLISEKDFCEICNAYIY